MQYQLLDKYNFRIEKFIYRKLNDIYWPLRLKLRKGKQRSKTESEGLRVRIAQLLTNEDISFIKENTSPAVILEEAYRALDHQVNVLGSGWKKLNAGDWNKDIISGKIWANGIYYKKYKIIDLSDSSDVKVPWEISRCHQLLHLGLAYSITGEEKYAEEVVAQVNSWIEENPLMYSINWTCAMDVAIRAVNWLFALRLIERSRTVTEDFLRKVTSSIYQHGLFIYNNLEDTPPNSGNHYMSDLVGLLFIGSMLDDKDAKGWYSFALSEFWSEIRKQFLPSGFHYEKSISYHRLMTELVAYTYVYLKRSGEVIPLDIKPRVKKMFEVIAVFTTKDGMAPAVADEDNGRFLPFVVHDFHDYSYLLSVYNYLFEQEWRPDTNVMMTFPEVGFSVFNDPEKYLFVSNTGISKYPEYGKWNGTHTHCDLLSFVLRVKGLDFIIDPGTFVYTRDVNKRDEYRSTAKHNTVQIDNIEQFTFRRDKPFSMFCDAVPAIISNKGDRIESSYIKHFEGKFYNHKRVFFLDDKVILIKDYVCCPGEHTAKMYFHLSQKINVAPKENMFELTNGSQTISLSYPDTLIGNVINDTISTSYGIEVPSKTLVLTGRFSETIEIETKIYIR